MVQLTILPFTLLSSILILRGQRFGPATLRFALWRVALSPSHWTEIVEGPIGMCRGKKE